MVSCEVEARVATLRYELVALVLVELIIVKFVIVEVPLFTKPPPVYVWRAVQVLAFPRLSEATTAPVVGEMVRVPSELETDETPVATHEPL